MLIKKLQVDLDSIRSLLVEVYKEHKSQSRSLE
jgi:hypothetical protein